MEIIDCEKDAGIELMNILGVTPECKYCGTAITEETFGGVFSKPSRVSCDKLCCLLRAIYDTDEESVDRIDGIIG